MSNQLFATENVVVFDLTYSSIYVPNFPIMKFMISEVELGGKTRNKTTTATKMFVVGTR